MKQIIPFVKEIVFKNNIASITSISLEHEEKIFDGEVSGDFIVFGDYKIHSDTTEKELFKYRLPFSALLPDNINFETVKVDIEDFTYDVIDRDVIKVNIDFLITADELEESAVIEPDVKRDEEEFSRKMDELLGAEDENIVYERNEEEKLDELDVVSSTNLDETLNSYVIDASDNFDYERDEIMMEKEEVGNKEDVIQQLEAEEESVIVNESNNDYVTYHIHIVNDNESLEDIIKMYNTNIDNIKIYNEITNINVGDKIIIPDNVDE